MTFRQARLAVTLAAVSIVCATTEAAAQLAPPGRASSFGVFRRGAAGAGDRPSLGLSGSLYGAYDNDIVAQLTNSPVSRPDTTRSGDLYGAGLSLGFQRPGRIDIGASAQAGLSYVPELSSPSATYYGTSGDVSTRLTDTTSLQMSGRFEYAPRYSLASRLFEASDGGDLPPLDDGLQGVEPLPLESYRHHLQAGISQRVSRRGTLTAGYRFQSTNFTGVDRDLEVHQASLTYSHELARDLSARFGYAYRRSIHQVSADLTDAFDSSHIIVSLDYDRGLTLSMTRRTYATFGFGTGVTQRESLDNGDGSGNARLFLTGQASLVHEMGRTWTTEVTYSRGLRFVDGFAEPLLTGNLVGAVGGLLTERLEFGAFARFGRGTGAADRGSTFRNIQSTMQVRYGLNRHTSIFVQGYHVVYEAHGRQLNFPLLVPDLLNRVGVRFGVNVWTPLLT